MTLGVGIRNIQKKLKEEGKAFSNYWMRLEKLAIKHLKQPYSSMTDIAYLLGYSEPSVFYRSFKKWTGQTQVHLELINNP
jgi:YesN/AraC family two-component response regulator